MINSHQRAIYAFFIAQFKAKSAQPLSELSKLAGQPFAAFGGEIAKRGALAEQLAGENPYSGVSIVGFSDMQTLENGFNSDDYQKLIPLRAEAADTQITAYEGR